MRSTTRDLINQRAHVLRQYNVVPNDGAFPPPAPAPAAGQSLVAVTVFTEYRLPGGGWGATCVCGEVYLDQLREAMRKRIAGHRCCDALGRPAPLLHTGYDMPDTPTTDTIERVLLGLRGLL